MSEIISILMDRDDMSRVEAEDELERCKKMVRKGADPDQVLYDELGLEPDYFFELLD